MEKIETALAAWNFEDIGAPHLDSASHISQPFLKTSCWSWAKGVTYDLLARIAEVANRQ